MDKILSYEDVKALPVIELRRELGKRGLEKSGLKVDLTKRLQKSMMESAMSKNLTEPDNSMDDEEEAKEEVEAVAFELRDSDEGNAAIGNEGSSGKGADSVDSIEVSSTYSEKPLKKDIVDPNTIDEQLPKSPSDEQPKSMLNEKAANLEFDQHQNEQAESSPNPPEKSIKPIELDNLESASALAESTSSISDAMTPPGCEESGHEDNEGQQEKTETLTSDTADGTHSETKIDNVHNVEMAVPVSIHEKADDGNRDTINISNTAGEKGDQTISNNLKNDQQQKISEYIHDEKMETEDVEDAESSVRDGDHSPKPMEKSSEKAPEKDITTDEKCDQTIVNERENNQQQKVSEDIGDEKMESEDMENAESSVKDGDHSAKPMEKSSEKELEKDEELKDNNGKENVFKTMDDDEAEVKVIEISVPNVQADIIVIDDNDNDNVVEEVATETKADDKQKDTKGKKKDNLYRSLWISGLSPVTKAAELKELFAQHGRVKVAKIVSSLKDAGSRFGFITMGSVEEAMVCIEKLHLTKLHEMTIDVDKARMDPTPRKKVRPKSTSADRKKDDKSSSTRHSSKTGSSHVRKKHSRSKSDDKEGKVKKLKVQSIDESISGSSKESKDTKSDGSESLIPSKEGDKIKRDRSKHEKKKKSKKDSKKVTNAVLSKGTDAKTKGVKKTGARVQSQIASTSKEDTIEVESTKAIEITSRSPSKELDVNGNASLVIEGQCKNKRETSKDEARKDKTVINETSERKNTNTLDKSNKEKTNKTQQEHKSRKGDEACSDWIRKEAEHVFIDREKQRKQRDVEKKQYEERKRERENFIQREHEEKMRRRKDEQMEREELERNQRLRELRQREREQEQRARERQDRDQREKERKERERHEHERLEYEQFEREKLERMRIEDSRFERERTNRVRRDLIVDHGFERKRHMEREDSEREYNPTQKRNQRDASPNTRSDLYMSPQKKSVLPAGRPLRNDRTYGHGDHEYLSDRSDNKADKGVHEPRLKHKESPRPLTTRHGTLSNSREGSTDVRHAAHRDVKDDSRNRDRSPHRFSETGSKFCEYSRKQNNMKAPKTLSDVLGRAGLTGILGSRAEENQTSLKNVSANRAGDHFYTSSSDRNNLDFNCGPLSIRDTSHYDDYYKQHDAADDSVARQKASICSPDKRCGEVSRFNDSYHQGEGQVNYVTNSKENRVECRVTEDLQVPNARAMKNNHTINEHNVNLGDRNDRFELHPITRNFSSAIPAMQPCVLPMTDVLGRPLQVLPANTVQMLHTSYASTAAAQGISLQSRMQPQSGGFGLTRMEQTRNDFGLNRKF